MTLVVVGMGMKKKKRRKKSEDTPPDRTTRFWGFGIHKYLQRSTFPADLLTRATTPCPLKLKTCPSPLNLQLYPSPLIVYTNTLRLYSAEWRLTLFEASTRRPCKTFCAPTIVLCSNSYGSATSYCMSGRFITVSSL